MKRAHVGRTGGWIVVWAIFCAVIVGAASTVVVLGSARSPLSSDEPAAAVVVDVGRQSRATSAVVGLTARRDEGVPVDVAAAGTVTALEVVPGKVLEAGTILATVDDLPVVAMSGSAPLYRDLTPGMSGKDVSRLQEFLAATGYLQSPADGRFGRSTARAVVSWNEDHGRSGDVFARSAVAWTGPDRFEVASAQVRVGDAVVPGDPIAIGPARLMGVDVDEPNGGIDSGDYVIEVGDATVPYSGGTGFVSGSEEAAELIEALGSDEGAATLTQAAPAEVAVVPASAVVTDAEGRTCVFPDDVAQAVLVEPVGSASGTVFLPRESPVTTVLVNPAQTRGELSCGS